MDHDRLRKGYQRLFVTLGILGIHFLGVGCSSKSELATKTVVPRTVLESQLSASRLFQLSENFLSYHLGYTLNIRDLERGLLVSSWSSEIPNQREQITLRITSNAPGSILSAHIKVEQLTSSGWQTLPTSGDREEKFLKDLKAYLARS